MDVQRSNKATHVEHTEGFTITIQSELRKPESKSGIGYQFNSSTICHCPRNSQGMSAVVGKLLPIERIKILTSNFQTLNM